MILQFWTFMKTYIVIVSYSLRKNKEDVSESITEPVLGDENPSIQDDLNKCKHQAAIQRYSYL